MCTQLQQKSNQDLSQLPQRNITIDYSTKMLGFSLFESAKSLEHLFDGTLVGLVSFRDQIDQKVTNTGWNLPGGNILEIQTRGDTVRYILYEYSLISVDDITTWARINIIGQQTRLVQNNHSLFYCLAKSIDQDFIRSRLSRHDSELYTIVDVRIALLFLKKIFDGTEVGSFARIA